MTDSPTRLNALLQAAFAHQQANRTAAAEAGYRQVLEADPGNKNALHLLADLLHQKGEKIESNNLIKNVISLHPEDPSLHLTAARIFYDGGDWPDCAASSEIVLRADPGNAEAELMRASTYMALRRFAEAESAILAVHRALLQDTGIRVFYIRTLMAQHKFDAATPVALETAALAPENADANYIAGACLKRTGKPDAAEPYLKTCLTLNPNTFEALNDLGDIYFSRGDVATALDFLKQSHNIKPFNTDAMSGLCFYTAFDHRAGPQELFALNRAYSEHLVAEAQKHTLPPAPPPRADGRIRIGFLAMDFFDHVTSWFMEPVFNRYDKATYHITCYSGAARPDHITERLQGLVDEWRQIDEDDTDGSADIIRRDGIDILMLCSFYRGKDRRILSHRIAPLQIAYNNRVASTAMDTIDYIITDEKCDPTGEVEQYYTETMIRVSNHSCYLPTADAPEPAPPPFLRNGFITFGSFNNHGKVNIKVIETWAALLAAVPDSKLLLRSSAYFDNPHTCDFFRERFKSFGTAPDRLIFHGLRKTRRDNLLGMQEADIALDPFPCNGGTTSRETLWMGLPLVTMTMDTFMSRQGVCYLSKVGLEDLIARTPDEYVELGRKLAADRQRIIDLRATLRPRVEAGILNYDQHIRELEAVYRVVWERHLAGQPPAPFHVTDGTVTMDAPSSLPGVDR